MKKLRSFALWMLGLASFVGLVVTLSLWIRTYFVHTATADAVTGGWMTPAEVRPFVAKNISVESWAGGVTLYVTSFSVTSEQEIERYQKLPQRGPQYARMGGRPFPDNWWQTLKPTWGSQTSPMPPRLGGSRTMWHVRLPYWLPSLLFALLPAYCVRRWLRARRRRAAGQCPTCGYDLRATPDRCPECGGAPVVVSAG